MRDKECPHGHPVQITQAQDVGKGWERHHAPRCPACSRAGWVRLILDHGPCQLQEAARGQE